MLGLLIDKSSRLIAADLSPYATYIYIYIYIYIYAIIYLDYENYILIIL
jgi:hypothetical protein